MTAEKETATTPHRSLPHARNALPRRSGTFCTSFPSADLWLGQAISQFGDALYFLVFVYMAEKLTGDPRIVGIVGVAQTLPFLLLVASCRRRRRPR